MELHNIHYLLNTVKEFSECVDKQVSCIITDKDDNVLSIGWNRVHECDQNCHDKENRRCITTHAEIQALIKLNSDAKLKAKKAYVSLFPCKPCQESLKKNGVTEVISFTANHKGHIGALNFTYPQNINDLLLGRDGVDTLNKIDYNNSHINHICNSLARLGSEVTCLMKDSYDPNVGMLYKYLSTELQLEQLKLILWSKDPLFYNRLRELRQEMRDNKLSNLNAL